jgi:hypothetical protein
VNQGCRLGVSLAITWFFEQVEEGIILEDDCVPHPDFFPYCATLLERYRHDTRVWCITGDNATRIKLASPDYSYGFIRYPLIWGWATWRRCWDAYRADFENLSEVASLPAFTSEIFNSNLQLATAKIQYWQGIKNGEGPDSWDAAWAYTCLVNSGMTILPRFNLVSNIGFGDDATHTLGRGGAREAANLGQIVPISHPPFMIRDGIAEHQFEEAIYETSSSTSVNIGRIAKTVFQKLRDTVKVS